MYNGICVYIYICGENCLYKAPSPLSTASLDMLIFSPSRLEVASQLTDGMNSLALTRIRPKRQGIFRRMRLSKKGFQKEMLDEDCYEMFA